MLYAKLGIIMLQIFFWLGVLPLDPKYSVAVIGPNSDATTTMQGNYHVNGHMHVTK